MLPRASFIEDRKYAAMLSSLDDGALPARFPLRAKSHRADAGVDLNALVGTVCTDQADMQRQVAYEEFGRLPYRCRPHSLTRAVRNLVENAIVHGRSARVHMNGPDEEVWITIEDEGPGIPDLDMGRVFQPFVRLDESRGQELVARPRPAIGAHRARPCRDILLRIAPRVALPHHPAAGGRRLSQEPAGARLRFKGRSDSIFPNRRSASGPGRSAQLLRDAAVGRERSLRRLPPPGPAPRGRDHSSPTNLPIRIPSIINHMQVAFSVACRQNFSALAACQLVPGRFPSHDIGRSRQAASVWRVEQTCGEAH